MEKNILNQLLINKENSIKQTMRLIDLAGWGVGFIVDENKKFIGVITDGDIRRAILKGINIEKPIKEITNTKATVVREQFADEEFARLKQEKDIKEKIPVGGSLKIPVIDNQGMIKNIIFLYDRDEKEKPKVLLIGGAGYLGSVICRRLLDQGYRVKILDNLAYGDWGIRELYNNVKFELLKGDIRNISDVVESIKGVDAVIHLAAVVGDPACIRDPKQTLEVNYLATKNIIDVCKYFQVNRFIFSSTCSVYGESPVPDKKLTEQSLLNPVSLYAETKIKCEQSILEAMDDNFSPTVMRMATLYGYSPNMRFDLSVNFITAKALFDKKITIFGGDQWRPWLHLEDASLAYIKCLEKPIEKVRGEVFNVLSENYKIIDVGKKINSVCPEAELQIREQQTDKRNYNVSFDKVSQMLDFQPQKRIINGVMEIKDAIERKLITSYKDSKYRTI